MRFCFFVVPKRTFCGRLLSTLNLGPRRWSLSNTTKLLRRRRPQRLLNKLNDVPLGGGGWLCIRPLAILCLCFRGKDALMVNMEKLVVVIRLSNRFWTMFKNKGRLLYDPQTKLMSLWSNRICPPTLFARKTYLHRIHVIRMWILYPKLNFIGQQTPQCLGIICKCCLTDNSLHGNSFFGCTSTAWTKLVVVFSCLASSN